MQPYTTTFENSKRLTPDLFLLFVVYNETVLDPGRCQRQRDSFEPPDVMQAHFAILTSWTEN